MEKRTSCLRPFPRHIGSFPQRSHHASSTQHAPPPNPHQIHPMDHSTHDRTPNHTHIRRLRVRTLRSDQWTRPGRPLIISLLRFLQRGDEPHGSLFVYFRIFTPLADDHVIASHVTSVTRPIPTFSDQLRSFPLICDDFRSFPIILVISDDFYLRPTSRKHCKPQLGTMRHCGSFTVR
jgi:hypothetical protein